MKYLIIIALLVVTAFAGWPYFTMYRLDKAVVVNDSAALAELVDMTAVREEIKQNIDSDVSASVAGGGKVGAWIRGGLADLTGNAVDKMIDIAWVRTTLAERPTQPPRSGPSFLDSVSFAFFESIDRFAFRVGELGGDPVHVRMELSELGWQVVAIYE